MGDRVEAFPCLISAGTTKTAPGTHALNFPPGYLRRIEVVIPDGVAGLAGFQISYGGQQVIPNTPGAWIIGNDERWADEPEGTMVGQQWQLVGYNADVNDHTFYARCYVAEISDAAQVADIIPTVLPVTITADTPIGITPGQSDTLSTLGPPPPTFDDTVTPLDIGAGDTVTPPDQADVPADTPADAPAVADPDMTDTAIPGSA